MVTPQMSHSGNQRSMREDLKLADLLCPVGETEGASHRKLVFTRDPVRVSAGPDI